MALGRIQAGGEGVFFKPGKYGAGTVLAIEVETFERQRPGKFGPKDTVTGPATIFPKDGEPEDVDRLIVNHAALTNTLESSLGTTVAVELAQRTSKDTGNNYWAFDDVDDETFDKVAEYLDAREAELRAEMEDAPSFDE